MISKEVLKPITLVFLVFAGLFAAIIGISGCANNAATNNQRTEDNPTSVAQVTSAPDTRTQEQIIATRISKRATQEAQPTRTPRPTSTPKPTSTPLPISPTRTGLNVNRNSIKNGMAEIGFVFNPLRTTPYESLYGSSTHRTSNGSVAQIEIFGSENHIREVQFKAFDIDIEPALGAAHTLMAFSLMFPEWEDATMAQWVADATGRALDGDVVKHRRSVRSGYAQIELFIRGTTLFVDVEVE